MLQGLLETSSSAAPVTNCSKENHFLGVGIQILAVLFFFPPAELLSFWSLLVPVEYKSMADTGKAILEVLIFETGVANIPFTCGQNLIQKYSSHCLNKLICCSPFYIIWSSFSSFLFRRHSFGFNYLEITLDRLINSEYL